MTSTPQTTVEEGLCLRVCHTVDNETVRPNSKIISNLVLLEYTLCSKIFTSTFFLLLFDFALSITF